MTQSSIQSPVTLQELLMSMKTVSARQLLITFIPSISILVAMVVVRVLFKVSMAAMTRDVTAIANIHPFSGILSNLGILLWCAAASICVLLER